VIELAPGLLGLAAICADRSWRLARRARALAAIGEHPPAPLAPSRVAVVCAASAAAVWWIAGPWGALAASVALPVVRLARSRRRTRRLEALLSRQLMDGIGSLAAAVRSGRSVHQAISATAEEVGDPLASSLFAIQDAVSAGRPFDQAVDEWGARVGSDDAALVAGTLILHRKMGGDLPAVLDRVAETLRDREAAVAEVRSMTAQARLSGAIVGSLPVAFLGVLWLVSRDDVVVGLSSPMGRIAVAVGLALEAGAYLWIRRLLEIR